MFRLRLHCVSNYCLILARDVRFYGGLEQLAYSVCMVSRMDSGILQFRILYIRTYVLYFHAVQCNFILMRLQSASLQYAYWLCFSNHGHLLSAIDISNACHSFSGVAEQSGFNITYSIRTFVARNDAIYLHTYVYIYKVYIYRDTVYVSCVRGREPAMIRLQVRASAT